MKLKNALPFRDKICLFCQSDNELLQLALAGNRQAEDDLFARYYQLAFNIAYRLVGNENDAADAVQEGFLNVWCGLHGFKGDSTFKTWLLKVVSNAAMGFGRRRGRQLSLVLRFRATFH